jgi:hypothetical protein
MRKGTRSGIWQAASNPRAADAPSRSVHGIVAVTSLPAGRHEYDAQRARRAAAAGTREVARRERARSRPRAARDRHPFSRTAKRRRRRVTASAINVNVHVSRSPRARTRSARARIRRARPRQYALLQRVLLQSPNSTQPCRLRSRTPSTGSHPISDIRPVPLLFSVAHLRLAGLNSGLENPQLGT